MEKGGADLMGSSFPLDVRRRYNNTGSTMEALLGVQQSGVWRGTILSEI